MQPSIYDESERQMQLTRHSPGSEEASLTDRVAHLMRPPSARARVAPAFGRAGRGAPSEVGRNLFGTAGAQA